jgi:hypothetical protein
VVFEREKSHKVSLLVLCTNEKHVLDKGQNFDEMAQETNTLCHIDLFCTVELLQAVHLEFLAHHLIAKISIRQLLRLHKTQLEEDCQLKTFLDL